MFDILVFLMFTLRKYELAEFDISIFQSFLYFEVYSLVEFISTNRRFPQVDCAWYSLGQSLISNKQRLFFHK